MAEATVTKIALNNAFRSLISEQPLSKISVGEICSRCGVNRKSFYYHYQDKYDIANSCFDLDFTLLSVSTKSTILDEKAVLYELCRYLYSNKNLYRRLFDYDGQNSFSNYLREKLHSYFQKRLIDKSGFKASFWSDAIAYSLKEWITSKKPADPDTFFRDLMSCVRIDSKIS